MPTDNSNASWDAELFFWNQWEFFTLLARCEFNTGAFFSKVESTRALSDNDKQLLNRVISHINRSQDLKKLFKDGIYVDDEEAQADMIKLYVNHHASEMEFWKDHAPALNKLLTVDELDTVESNEKYPTEYVFITVLDEDNPDVRKKSEAVEQLKKLCVKAVNRYEEKYARESQLILADFKQQLKGKKVSPDSLQSLHEMVASILGDASQPENNSGKSKKVSDEFDVYFTKLRERHPAFEALYFKRDIFRQISRRVIDENLTPNARLTNIDNYLSNVNHRALSQQSNSLRKALERVLTKIAATINPKLGHSAERLFSTHAAKAFGKVKSAIFNTKPGAKG